MKTINEHIKSQEFKQVYLLYGEETYLVKQYKDRLKNAIIGDDTMNYGYFEGNKIDAKELIALANTMPFFAERRLIVIQDSGFLKSASEGIAELIKEMPEYLYILFVESDIDKRNRVYKAIVEKGYACEMKYQSDSVLMKWIGNLIAAEKKTIQREAMQELIGKTGVSMETIRMEVEKLLCYCMDKEEITAQDVDGICTTQVQNKIFDMITAIAQKNQRVALDLYNDLLVLREPPMRILYLISQQFNKMLQVKELAANQINSATIAKELGIPAFLVGKYLAQAKSFTKEQLLESLEYFAAREQDVKTGKLGDALAVELIIVKYSKK